MRSTLLLIAIIASIAFNINAVSPNEDSYHNLFTQDKMWIVATYNPTVLSDSGRVLQDLEIYYVAGDADIGGLKYKEIRLFSPLRNSPEQSFYGYEDNRKVYGIPQHKYNSQQLEIKDLILLYDFGCEPGKVYKTKTATLHNHSKSINLTYGISECDTIRMYANRYLLRQNQTSESPIIEGVGSLNCAPITGDVQSSDGSYKMLIYCECPEYSFRAMHFFTDAWDGYEDPYKLTATYRLAAKRSRENPDKKYDLKGNELDSISIGQAYLSRGRIKIYEGNSPATSSPEASIGTEEPYHNLFTDGKIWTMANILYPPQPDNAIASITTYAVIGDIEIGGLKCKRISRYNELTHKKEGTYYGYEQDKKAYIVPYNHDYPSPLTTDDLLLLCDFGCDVDKKYPSEKYLDTNTFKQDSTYYVTDADTIETSSGKHLRRLQFHRGTWIEGVGALTDESFITQTGWNFETPTRSSLLFCYSPEFEIYTHHFSAKAWHRNPDETKNQTLRNKSIFEISKGKPDKYFDLIGNIIRKPRSGHIYIQDGEMKLYKKR